MSSGPLRVFEHPLSPYAQKVKIALAEKGVPFEVLTPADLGSGALAAEFAAANPRGEVPVLFHGDLALFDSSVILAYIEETWPTPPLLPAAPVDRARVRTLEDVMDTHYEAINWGLGEIFAFGRAKGALALEIAARAKQQTADLQRWLEQQLGSEPWFNGEAFGWGDLCVAPFVNASAAFGNGPAAGTQLAGWHARVNLRPSVAAAAAAAQKAAQDSALSLETFSELVEQGLFKRQYRDHRLEWMIKSGGLQVVLDGLARHNIRFTEFSAA